MDPTHGEPDALLRQLTTIDTATLANAIEKLNVRKATEGYCDMTVRQLFTDMGVLCGYAVTAEAVTMVDEPGDRDRNVRGYMDVCAALRDTPKPAVVVIHETGPRPEFGVHCGEVMATMFKRFGAVGLVSDVAVRDVNEVRKLGFQLFGAGTVASHGHFRITRVQVPVDIRGMPVRPGDLLHGDANGLITVPEQGRERLADLAADVLAKERRVLDYLNGENVTLDELARRLTH